MAEIDKIPAIKESKLRAIDVFAMIRSFSFLGSHPLTIIIFSMPKPESPTADPVLLDTTAPLLKRYALIAYPIHPEIGIIITANTATIISILNPHAALAIVLYWGDARSRL